MFSSFSDGISESEKARKSDKYRKNGDELEELFKMITKVKGTLENQNAVPSTIVPNYALEQIWKKVDKKVRKMTTQLGQWEKDQLCEEIWRLTKKFIDCREIERAYEALHCEFYLIKKFYDVSLHKLQKLQQLGVSMQQIIDVEKENHINHKTEYDLMDSILDEMNDTSDSDKLDLEVKCEFVTRFCISYGYYCIKTENFNQPIKILNKAIFILQVVFGKDYKHHKLLSLCYQNISKAYHDLGKDAEAKIARSKAERAKQQAADWKKQNPEKSEPAALNIHRQ